MLCNTCAASSAPWKHHVRPTVWGIIVVHMRNRANLLCVQEKSIQSLWSRSYASWKTWLTECSLNGKHMCGRAGLSKASRRCQIYCRQTVTVCCMHHRHSKEPDCCNCSMGRSHWCSSWPAVLPEILDKCLNKAKPLKLKFLSRKRRIWMCGIPNFFFRCEELCLSWNSWVTVMTIMLKHVNCI